MKLVLVFALVCSACAKAPMRSGVAPLQVTPTHAGHDPEIETLDREIEDALAKMQVSRPATPAGAHVTMSSKVNVLSDEDPACKHGSSDVCTRSCTLADSICKNAKRICDIASKLGNDPWANDKCSGGTESCRVAHESCCSCN